MRVPARLPEDEHCVPNVVRSDRAGIVPAHHRPGDVRNRDRHATHRARGHTRRNTDDHRPSCQPLCASGDRRSRFSASRRGSIAGRPAGGCRVLGCATRYRLSDRTVDRSWVAGRRAYTMGRRPVLRRPGRPGERDVGSASRGGAPTDNSDRWRAAGPYAGLGWVAGIACRRRVGTGICSRCRNRACR